VPPASGRHPWGLRGAQGGVFFPKAAFFAEIHHRVILTRQQQKLRLPQSSQNTIPWGDTQMQSNNHELIRTCCRLNHPDESGSAGQAFSRPS